MGLGKRALSYDAKDYFVNTNGKKINGTAPRKDTVTITSVSPATGSTLKTGDTVTFDLKADYDFRSAQTGRIVLGFTESGDLPTILASEPTRRGKGKPHSTDRSKCAQHQEQKRSHSFFSSLQDSVRGTAMDRKSFRVEQSAESFPDTPSRITVNISDDSKTISESLR